MNSISPIRHANNDVRSPVLSIKTLSPIASPTKQMVKSASIIITSTSNECSPSHSVNEDMKDSRLRNQITNAFQNTATTISNVESSNSSPNPIQNDQLSDPACKTTNHNGNWRPFRRDKVTPLKVEDPGPIIHTYPASYTNFSMESTKQITLGNVTTDESTTHHDQFDNNVAPPLQPVSTHTSSINTISYNPSLKPSKLPHILPRQASTSTDNSVFPVNNANSLPPFGNKSDTLTLATENSEFGLTDLEYLSVPQNGSWKNLDDSMTISTIQGPMSGTGSAMSVTRSLESKIKLSTSDKSNFIFQSSPLGSIRRNLSIDEHGSSSESSPIACKFTNLSTTQGRQWNAAMILALSVAPIIALLIQNCINLYRNNNVFIAQESIKSDILYSVEIGTVMHFTQIERGTTVLFVSTSGQDILVNSKLRSAYNDTDKAIGRLSKWLSEKNPPHFRTEEDYWNRIRRFRGDVWQGQVKDVETVLDFYSNDNAVIERWIGKSVQLSTNGDLWRTLIGYYMLIISKEQAGVERALGGSFYAQSGFTNPRMQHYLQRKVTGQNFLVKAEEYATAIDTFIESNFRGTILDTDLNTMRTEILRNSLSKPDPDQARKWFEQMTKYIDLLKQARRFTSFHDKDTLFTPGGPPNLTSVSDRTCKIYGKYFSQGDTVRVPS